MDKNKVSPNADAQFAQSLKDERNNILTACHTLKFSKKNKNCFDVANIERRSLALKYMTTKLFDSESMPAVLLRQSLEDYHNLLRDKNGVNNYWKQIKSQLLDVKNNPLQWKTKLEDEEVTLSFVKSLACRKPLNTLPCKAKSYSNRDIEKLMSISRKSNVSERNRKVSQARREDAKIAPLESFRSARDELYIQEMKKNKLAPKKTLGGRAAVNSQFVCPFKRDKEESEQSSMCQGKTSTEEVQDERLKNIDANMIELIKNEIMDSGKTITWDDIAGLEYIKKIIKEVVVFPMLRPDIFTGLRRPPKGILLFGPPGTGKTLIGKCIASQSKSTFFSISASSLTSKWIGDGEKMVRALFAVAKVYQPSVIFIDEIDSLLTQRSETEHESSRRLKTEFLVQLDGAATSEDDRILIVGATNRPQELDEAARRRLVKRLYVPLPEFEARKQIINNLLRSVHHNLNEEDITRIAEKSEGYSGADMTNLCKEASMEPIRSIPFSQLEDIRMEEVRHITKCDFDQALVNVRPSVSQSDLNIYITWDCTYGSGTAQNYKT
ncbi:hypothetical protein PUN28_016853 [Cardiocondyla obscurior]|uniref:Fidgetin-like protein 1 n=1 Tax=Cardiocondyla obscurior TaxID=286306 RepID=A0AAW2EQQ3_9HYME